VTVKSYDIIRIKILKVYHYESSARIRLRCSMEFLISKLSKLLSWLGRHGWTKAQVFQIKILHLSIMA